MQRKAKIMKINYQNPIDFEKNLCPKIHSVDIKSSLVSLDGQATKVVCQGERILCLDNRYVRSDITINIPCNLYFHIG